jgi:hypothetical protein
LAQEFLVIITDIFAEIKYNQGKIDGILQKERSCVAKWIESQLPPLKGVA